MKKLFWMILVCVLVLASLWLAKPKVVGMINEVIHPSAISAATTLPINLGKPETVGVNTVTADGVYVVLRSELEAKNEQGIVYSHNSAGLKMPITFGSNVNDVSLNLKCDAYGNTIFDSIRKINNCSKSGDNCYAIHTYSNSSYIVGGLSYLNCNATYPDCDGDGSRIKSAVNGANAVATFWFFFYKNNETFDINCEAEIISSDPYQKAVGPFSIRYVYD
jgi:hypothetical protein